MVETVSSSIHWYWWIFALLLVILELFIPGTFFLWSAVAAGVLGILLYIAPTIGIELQIFLFSVISIIGLVLTRIYLKRHPIQSDKPLLNQRGSEYLGRTFTLNEPIVDNSGRIHIDDSFWRVEGADCPEGTRVRVIGINGIRLQVQIIESDPPATASPSSSPSPSSES